MFTVCISITRCEDVVDNNVFAFSLWGVDAFFDNDIDFSNGLDHDCGFVLKVDKSKKNDTFSSTTNRQSPTFRSSAKTGFLLTSYIIPLS